MEYDTKVRQTETVADWTAQLSNIIFDKIGSIYMRFEQENLLFFVGQSANYLFPPKNRLLFDAARGPFVMLESYYAYSSQSPREMLRHLLKPTNPIRSSSRSRSRDSKEHSLIKMSSSI